MVNEHQSSLEEAQIALEGDQPVFKAKIGAFQTAVFLNEVNGRSTPSVQLEKSFTNGQGWRHYKMTLLSSKEIDKLICVLEDTKRALYDGLE